MWFVDLTVKGKITKLIEDNIGVYLHYLGLWVNKDFLNTTQKTLTKGKLWSWIRLKLGT